MKLKSLICNLKANFNLEDVLEYKKVLVNHGDIPNLIVCPSFCFLPVMYSKNYQIGAQDVSEYGNGAYTGKVSVRMLKSLRVSAVLLNHAELKNKKSKVLAKLKKCLKAKMPVYIFISETAEEHNYQYTLKVLQNQIAYYLKNISHDNYQYISFIYEPNWLIGETSLEATEINNLIYILKKELENTYQHSFNILYGGGVNLSLVEALKDSFVDGFAIGNNSLDVNNILNIVNTLKK